MKYHSPISKEVVENFLSVSKQELIAFKDIIETKIKNLNQFSDEELNIGA